MNQKALEAAIHFAYKNPAVRAKLLPVILKAASAKTDLALDAAAKIKGGLSEKEFILLGLDCLDQGMVKAQHQKEIRKMLEGWNYL